MKKVAQKKLDTNLTANLLLSLLLLDNFQEVFDK